MFLKPLLAAALTILTTIQVQALRITYPTDKVHQIDINTPLMLSWTSNASDPAFVDIAIKFQTNLYQPSSAPDGIAVLAYSLPTNKSVYLVDWQGWPWRMGMLCQITLGSYITQKAWDSTDVFQLVNINPASAYGRQSSTTPSKTAPAYTTYSVSLPSFSELNSNMTRWACTQTSWDFSGQSPNIHSYLKTATDCEQYSTTTTSEDVTPTSTEGSSSTGSTGTAVSASASTTTPSINTSSTAKPPMTSAGSTTALPTQTSGSSPSTRRASAVVLTWAYGMMLALSTVILFSEVLDRGMQREV